MDVVLERGKLNGVENTIWSYLPVASAQVCVAQINELDYLLLAKDRGVVEPFLCLDETG